MRCSGSQSSHAVAEPATPKLAYDEAAGPRIQPQATIPPDFPAEGLEYRPLTITCIGTHGQAAEHVASMHLLGYPGQSSRFHIREVGLSEEPLPSLVEHVGQRARAPKPVGRKRAVRRRGSPP